MEYLSPSNNHHGNIYSAFTDQRLPIGTSSSMLGIRAASNNRLVFKAKNGRFSLSFDNGNQKSKEFHVETGEWQKYEPFVMEDVKLTQGKHVMTLNIANAVNIDRIEFVKK